MESTREIKYTYYRDTSKRTIEYDFPSMEDLINFVKDDLEIECLCCDLDSRFKCTCMANPAADE